MSCLSTWIHKFCPISQYSANENTTTSSQTIFRFFYFKFPLIPIFFAANVVGFVKSSLLITSQVSSFIHLLLALVMRLKIKHKIACTCESNFFCVCVCVLVGDKSMSLEL